jgi:hypothetical protein
MDMETFSQILEISKNITLIIAGWVGIYGINKWRKEFIDKKKIDLA